MVFAETLLNKMLNLLRNTSRLTDGAQSYGVTQVFGHSNANLDGFFVAHLDSLTPVRL